MIKEKKTINNSTVKFQYFSIKTKEPEKFIDELEKLCRSYCDNSNYYFKFSVEE